MIKSLPLFLLLSLPLQAQDSTNHYYPVDSVRAPGSKNVMIENAYLKQRVDSLENKEASRMTLYIIVLITLFASRLR